MSDSQTMQRIERLEQEIAELRARTVQAQTVCAGELRVVDGAGHVRAHFGLDEEGRPLLQMFDAGGHARVKLTLTSNGPGITLADAAGHTRAWLGFTKDAVRVGFADEEGNNRVFMGLMPEAGPVVRFYDEEQNVVWSAP